MPGRTYHVQADGTAVCPHRDLSVCGGCATDENLVEVAGVHYFVEDPSERDDLRAVLAEIDDEYRGERHLQVVR